MKETTVNITLRELAEVGIHVNPHELYPNWYGNTTVGPFETAHDAVLAEIKRIYELYQEYKELWNSNT